MWYVVVLMVVGYSLFGGIVLVSFNKVNVSAPTQFIIIGTLGLCISSTITAVLKHSSLTAQLVVAVLIILLSIGLNALWCDTKLGKLLTRLSTRQWQRMRRS